MFVVGYSQAYYRASNAIKIQCINNTKLWSLQCKKELLYIVVAAAAVAKSLESCPTKPSINNLLSPYYDPGMYFALLYILYHLFLTMLH